MSSLLPNPPSLVEHNSLRFLIFDAPTDENLDTYLQEFKRVGIQHIVRACDPSYATEKLTRASITVHEMPFQDGGSPSHEIVQRFLSLCKQTFRNPGQTIGVHCVAGLGRAPVLVAIALLEEGMEYVEVIEFIRKKRRGAINAKQVQYLRHYKPSGGKCIVM